MKGMALATIVGIVMALLFRFITFVRPEKQFVTSDIEEVDTKHSTK